MKSLFLIPCLLLSAPAFSGEPQSAAKQYMFNVLSADGLIPSQKQVEAAIEMEIKKTISDVACLAQSQLLTYAVTETGATVPPHSVVGVGAARLTSNCKETADMVLNSWMENSSLEVFPDQSVGPWPVVSGGN